MKILKFGGSSVQTPERIEGVVKIIKECCKNDNIAAIIFSAFGGITDLLLKISALAASGNKDYLTFLNSLKDNHIKMIGSVKNAIKKINKKNKDKIVEIEVENEIDAMTAAKLNVDVIMLDNIPPEKAEYIAKKIRNVNKNIKIEVSGGITKKNIRQYAPFADRISLGYITNSIKSMDFSLEIENNLGNI